MNLKNCAAERRWLAGPRAFARTAATKRTITCACWRTDSIAKRKNEITKMGIGRYTRETRDECPPGGDDAARFAMTVPSR